MSVTDLSETAALVRETRKRLGLTQVKFAQSLGVSFQSVNRWENRKTKSLPIVLKQIEFFSFSSTLFRRTERNCLTLAQRGAIAHSISVHLFNC